MIGSGMFRSLPDRPGKAMTKKKILVSVAVMAVLVGLYAAAGFYGVPRLVRSQVTELFQRDYGRTVSLGEVRFNPFTFEFEARDFSVPDADGTRMLGFDRFYVNFESSSLWHRAWTFAEIDLDAPYVKLVQRPDGAINLLDLVPATDEAPVTAEEETGIPSLWIADFKVSAGQVDIEDLARTQPFATTLAPVTFELADFRTTGAGNSFAFTAGSDLAGRLAVEGEFGVDPLSSRGSLTLTELQATAVSEYLGELLPVTLQGGVIDLGFNYEFELTGDPLRLVIDMPSLTVRDLVTQAHGYSVPWRIGSVALSGTRADLAASSVVIGQVEVRDADAPLWRDASGIHLPGALGIGAAVVGDGAGPASPPEPSPGTQDAAPAPAWTVSVPVIRFANLRLPAEDRTLQPAAASELLVETVELGDFAMPAQAPLKVQATVSVGTGGRLVVGGEATLDPVTANVDVKVQDLNLKPVQAYLKDTTDLLFDSGAVSSEGRVQLEGTDPLQLTYEGDVSVADLKTRDRPLKEDFVKWKSLDIGGIRYSSEPARLAIREIVAHQPYLRLVLAENGITNIEAVLDPEAAAAKAATIAAERAASDGKKKKQDEDETPDPAVEKKEPAATSEPGMAITIGNTRIVDGNANFADFTVKPNFQIAMEQLNGFIKGSSSDPASRSELKLDGQVDRYAPVHIAGQLNLLAPATYIDIEGDFSNIDLTSFNPYSTKFIGYQIAKGKLSIDTSYKVENDQLAALHSVKVDQLEFGEKIDSPDAIGLPVKLAVALLKDSQGVIQIDLPVEGTVDDPQFKLGPVIWKAFVGLLTKIVTAPFALLGNLFGGGEDLSYIDFMPGSADLSGEATEKAATLRKALTERPALKLDIPWTAVPALDRPVLEAAAWESALNAAADPEKGNPEAWKSDRQAYLRRLERLYEQQQGQKPEIPKPPKPAEGEAKADPVEFAIGQLEPGLKATVTVGAEQLEELAQARAIAVRNALLGEEGLDAERVFVSRKDEAEAAGEAVRMTLSLE
jgi:hypothetical protein